jgi:hypothetical protein
VRLHISIESIFNEISKKKLSNLLTFGLKQSDETQGELEVLEFDWKVKQNKNA